MASIDDHIDGGPISPPCGRRFEVTFSGRIEAFDQFDAEQIAEEIRAALDRDYDMECFPTVTDPARKVPPPVRLDDGSIDYRETSLRLTRDQIASWNREAS